LYPHPVGGVPVWLSVLCFGLLAAATWLVLANIRKRPYLLTGWLWYGITLVPVIGLVQVGNQSMADRYSYLPSVGISMMLAWAAAEFSSRWPARKIILSVLSGVLAAGMILGTRNQTAYWKDTETLYRHTLAVTQNNFVITTNLADYIWKQGKFEEAIHLHYQALKITSMDTVALNNLSWYLSTAPQERLRNPAKAVELAQRACRLTSFKDPAMLDTLAVAYAAAGQFQEAIQTAQQALVLAEAENKTQMAEEISRKMKLYIAGQGYIEPSAK
jgi:tetratricopeptide (TPR) repeat protein